MVYPVFPICMAFVLCFAFALMVAVTFPGGENLRTGWRILYAVFVFVSLVVMLAIWVMATMAWAMWGFNP